MFKKFFSFFISLIIVFNIYSINIPFVFANEDTSNKETTNEQKVSFNRPIEMRSTYIDPEKDFLVKENMSSNDVIKNIDETINYIKSLNFNTIILNTVYKNTVIYTSEIFKTVEFSDQYFDILKYFINKVKENKLYIYIDYKLNIINNDDKTLTLSKSVNSNTINRLTKMLDEVLSYDIDAIILNDYYNSFSNAMYREYREQNSGNDFTSWIKEWVSSSFSTLSFYIKDKKPNIQFGVFLDEVWVQNSINPEGTPSNKPFSALNDGFADTKAIVEKTNLDFVIVKTSSTTTDNGSNFSNVLNWWSNIINTKNIPFYIQHNNELIGTNQPGWQRHDEIIRQVIAARDIAGFAGSSFQSLSSLRENKFNSTQALIKYYKNEVDTKLLLSDFTISNIQKNTFTTYETEQSFIGAADPNFDLLLNDEKINVEKNGAFSISKPLNVGKNIFLFKHKGQEYKYDISRTVNVFESVSPIGTLRTEGGTVIELTAKAYKGSNVTAKISGTNIKLVESELKDDNKTGNSYATFVGSYKIPEATEVDRSIGNVSFTGSFQGVTQSKIGANIIINKKFVPPVFVPPVQPPVIVPPSNNDNNSPYVPSPFDNYQMVIIKNNADGYDPGYNTIYPAVTSHSLPKGTIDYIISNKIVFNNVTYYILASGTKIKESDLQFVDNKKYGFNNLNQISFTKIDSKLRMTINQKYAASFKIIYNNVKYDVDKLGIIGDFNPDSISIKFSNTKTKPNINLPTNNLFKNFSWHDISESNNGHSVQLNLNLQKQGRFLGFTTSYDANGNLNIDFNYINNGSLNGVKIFVDPGHGGTDPGNISHIHGQQIREADLNRSIAKKLAKSLQDKGATVQIADTNTYIGLYERAQLARNFGANLFISVHNNSATATASGVETWWFNPMSKSMAKKTNDAIASSTGAKNRGAKWGNYVVTRYQDFPAMMIECGFMTNQSELTNLLNDSYQQKIADSSANAVEDYVKSLF